MNSKEPVEEPPVRSVFKRSVAITVVIGGIIGGIFVVYSGLHWRFLGKNEPQVSEVGKKSMEDN